MESYKDQQTNNSIKNSENKSIEFLDKEHFDVFVISALEHHSTKINEGSKGIILKVDLSDFTDEELSEVGIKINRERGSVFKILKIENSFDAQNEYRVQSKACRILNTEESRQEGLAKVPEISKCEDVDLSGHSSLINKLKKSGVHLSKENSKINIMIMDYVPGVTMSHYIFKKIIEKIVEKDSDNSIVKHEMSGDPERWISVATFENFCKFLEKYFHISLKSDNSDIIKGNEKLFLSYMEKNDVILDKNILEIFRKSVLKLNEGGVCHRDLHTNNVILEFDKNSVFIDMYLIDFGEGEDSYVGEDSNDLAIYSAYIDHTNTKKEKIRKKMEDSTKGFERDLKVFEKKDNTRLVNKVYNAKYLIERGAKNNDIDGVVDSLIQQIIFPGDENCLTIALILMLENKEISKNSARDILERGLSSSGSSAKWILIKNILLTKKLI